MIDSDRKTFKLKNYHKKKKEKDSNSSRESLEIEIKSFKNNKKISQKKTGEGEEIKFFFNETPITKKSNVSKFKLSPISSNKTNPHPTFNLLNEKNESNFKDILLHYVKSPENQTKKKIDEDVDRRSSIIHGDPQTVLTLNGDESSNNSEIKEKKDNKNKELSKSKSDSSSVSKSESESNSNSEEESYHEKNSNKNSWKIKEKNKKELKDSKESSYKNNTLKYDDSMEKYSNSYHSKKINDYEDEENEKNEIDEKQEIKIEKQENESNHKARNEEIVKKLASSESNVQKSNKDSCFNSYKNSQKMKSLNSNTVTTNTNTHNYQNTHNSSLYSLRNNSNKKENNYLYLNDLSFKKQLLIKNRNNSIKKIITIKDLPKEDFIKDENTSIMIYKLKNLRLSLDIEKSYSHQFKYLSNIQTQKSHYKNSNSNQNISNSNNYSKQINESNMDSNFYYPDEYYISKNNILHQKVHVSNFFDKIKKLKKNT
jgi:hypothetical protein